MVVCHFVYSHFVWGHLVDCTLVYLTAVQLIIINGPLIYRQFNISIQNSDTLFKLDVMSISEISLDKMSVHEMSK
jgi:hypothetical protein